MLNINFEKLSHLNNRNNKVYIQIPNPKETIIYFWEGLMKEKIQWIPEYDAIANWLGDNKGTGLFLYGANGRGKSVMIGIVIPAILLHFYKKVVYKISSKGMNERNGDLLILPELLNKKLLSIDDVGKECDINHYGEIRVAFAEIMDNAEKNGNFILASSNLDATELLEKYDNAVIERIKTCCVRVAFDKKEKSLRKSLVYQK